MPLAQAPLAFTNAETMMQDPSCLDTAAAVAGYQQTEEFELWSDLTPPMQQDYFGIAPQHSISGSQTPSHEQQFGNAALTPPVNG
jgi:hypothetical protein